MIIERDNNHLMNRVVQLIGMNYHIFNHADYLMKKKAVRQTREEEAKEDASKNHCVKEKLHVKEGPRGAEKLGPRNKTNTQIDK